MPTCRAPEAAHRLRRRLGRRPLLRWRDAAPAVAAAIDAFHGAFVAASAVPSVRVCLADGVLAGEAAANAILLLRNGDGSATPHLPYNLSAGPGVYQPTPITPATPTPGAAVPSSQVGRTLRRSC